MGSLLRIQSDEVLYHVVSRGVDKQMIFGVVNGDRHVFLKLLERTVVRYGWHLHAYCLMGNHFHLVIDTPRSNIGDGMRYLKSAYALWFNAERARQGHLFERVYYADVLEAEAHLFAVSRYVVLNPVRAGLCRHPADWRWSSYRATAALIAAPPFLTTDFLHEIFGGMSAGPRRYAQFVLDFLVPPDRLFETWPTSEAGHVRTA
jgi:REP element-mobilizing transposase RayT